MIVNKIQKNIVKKNLKLMQKKGRGGMCFTANAESWGKKLKGVNSCWVNFFYDKNTGNIIVFGNAQYIADEIKNNTLNVGGVFIIDKKMKIRKINYFPLDSKRARINLSLSAGLYNELREKKIKSQAA